ncbi:FecR family protein [Phenylobacterium sp.]|jgi:transmembrane sensor|uniref:FecR family protein n=1 Tax=Phenylobacterium sp. TaxID=1871053 RepID=UPI002F3FA2C7
MADELPSRRPAARSAASRRGWLAAGGLAAAVTIAIAIMPPGVFGPPATRSFTTAPDERRSLSLADGSKLDLNAGARLTVTLDTRERRAVVTEGEAVFEVAADKSRPFLIAAGDSTIRAVGARFDVRRRAGRLSVTVERGLVEVRPGDKVGGGAIVLRPGQRLELSEGASGVQVSPVEPIRLRSDGAATP